MAVAIVATLVALHVATLMRFPPPFVDEAWAANRSWALLQTGVAFGDLDSGVFEHFEAYTTYFPLLPTALQGAAIWFVGAPALLPVRLVCLAFGIVLLVACYQLGTTVANRGTGLLSCTLTALSVTFTYSSHLGRWDIIIAAAGYSSLAILLANDVSRVSWKALLAGAVAGLAVEVHPHALVFIAAGGLLYLIASGWRAVLRADALAWGAGVAAGASFYVLVHLLHAPRSFLALAALAHGPTHTPPVFTLNARIITASFAGALTLIRDINPVAAFTYGAAVIGLVAMVRRPEARKSLTLVGVVLSSFSLLVRNSFSYYAVLITPALDVAVAVFLWSSATSKKRSTFLQMSMMLVVISLVLATAVTASLVAQNGSRDFDRTVARLSPSIRKGDVLIGAQTYWLALRTHKYYSWEQLVYYKRFVPGASVEDALRELRPDVLILDGHMSRFVSDSTDGEYGGHLYVPRKELLDVLARRATLVSDFEAPSYGRIRVFRFHWE